MTKHFVDRVGIVLSIVCGIHCILTPIILIFSPWLASYWANEYFHIVWLIVTSAVMTSVIARHGIRTQVAKIGAAGLVLVLFGATTQLFEGGHGHHEEEFHLLEIIPTLIGGVFLLIAHLKSIRSCACKPEKEVLTQV